MIVTFSKNPTHHQLELITSINKTIRELNEIYEILEVFARCKKENEHIQCEVLGSIEEQQYHYSKLISELETRKESVQGELDSLGALHIMERKRLSHELQVVESEISLNYNNFCRMRENYSDAVDKLVKNREFIASHPTEPLMLSYVETCNNKLNPSIKKLSSSMKTNLATIDCTRPQKLEEFLIEIINEDVEEFE